MAERADRAPVEDAHRPVLVSTSGARGDGVARVEATGVHARTRVGVVTGAVGPTVVAAVSGPI